jgi:TonB family protein
VYPDEAKRAGIEGVVALELTIDREGRVSASRVVTPAGHGFDEAAEEAARRFVFRPALRAGKPVVAKIRYTYAFRLETPLAVAPTPPPERADATEPTTPSTPSPEVEEPPEEINVRGEKEEREAPKRSLDREELRTMPGVNGDPLRAVTSLPGVARAPAFSDVFVVRGSSPAGSAAFLDGSFLPRPFHFGGLASVVPAEMIDRIDFFPGNFAARYGRVDGGLVDIVTRSPAKDRLHALAQVDLLDGRVFAEGPLPGFPGWSFAIGARRSWLDAWLGPVLESGGVGARTAPYYYDGQVFLETHPTARSTVRIGLYTSSDAMNLTLGKIPSGGDPSVSGGLQSQQGFSRMQINYRADWGDRAHASALLSVGSDDGATRVGTVFARSRVDLLTSRGELAYDFARFLTLRGGWDILAATVDLSLRVPRDPRPGQVDPGPLAGQRFVVFDQTGIRAARPGAFFDAVIRPAEALTITPGVRADYTYEVRELTASPRVNARWQTHGGPFATALRGGVGEYRQSIDYNYVANAFGARDLRSSRSIHGSIGVEQSLGDAASITVEGFVKKLDGIVSHDASKGGPDANANGGSGRVVGAELLAKLRPRGRLSGFLSYTLSRSTREDAPGAPTRLFEYDQTHVLTAVGSYRLGRGWSLGGRFRYASGNPFTPCVGGSFAADAGLYGCVTGAPFSARVPAFAQLDVRLDKTWELSEWKLSAYLDVQNATNRENPEGALDKFDKSARTYQAGLPILPILGLRGEL